MSLALLRTYGLSKKNGYSLKNGLELLKKGQFLPAIYL